MAEMCCVHALYVHHARSLALSKLPIRTIVSDCNCELVQLSCSHVSCSAIAESHVQTAVVFESTA